jgi:hypothetical protein
MQLVSSSVRRRPAPPLPLPHRQHLPPLETALETVLETVLESNLSPELAPVTLTALPVAVVSNLANVLVPLSPRNVTGAADLVMHSPTTTQLVSSAVRHRPVLPHLPLPLLSLPHEHQLPLETVPETVLESNLSPELAPVMLTVLPAAAASNLANVLVPSLPRNVMEAADLVMHSPTTTQLVSFAVRHRPAPPLPLPHQRHPLPLLHQRLPPPLGTVLEMVPETVLESNLSLELVPATPTALLVAAVSNLANVLVP